MQVRFLPIDRSLNIKLEPVGYMGTLNESETGGVMYSTSLSLELFDRIMGELIRIYHAIMVDPLPR